MKAKTHLLCLGLLLLEPDEQHPAPVQRLVLCDLGPLAARVAALAKVLHRLARVLHALQAERGRRALEEVALARERVEVLGGAGGGCAQG